MSGEEDPLETTKRKFYKLLENFTSISPQSAASTTPWEPPYKRLRRPGGKERPQSMPPGQGNGDFDTASGHAEASQKEFIPRAELRYLVAEQRRRDQEQEVKKKPRQIYAPGDQELFLDRLKSFADIKLWTPKPEEIAELAWALRGWICQEKDTVICPVCESKVHVGFSKEEAVEGKDAEEEVLGWWSDAVQTKLVNKYKALIVSGHNEGCPWLNRPCPGTIFNMHIADPNIWQPELKQRYQSLLPFISTLPENLKLPPNTADARVKFELDRMANAVKDIVLDPLSDNKENESMFTSEEVTQQEGQPPRRKVEDKALALALCGWSGLETSGVGLIQCNMCFQRCGLWLYSSSGASKARSTTSESDEAMAFDPVELHRSYCPWKNPKSQGSSGLFEGYSGWQVEAALVEFEADAIDRKERQRIQELRAQERANEYYEPTYEDHIERNKRMDENERDVMSRLAKIKRVFSSKKPVTRLQKKKSIVDGPDSLAADLDLA